VGRGRSTFRTDLRTVLAGQNFRRLFATRLVSQAGDGIITAGVGTFVFFNASSFPSPAAGAAAFTVLYLPYSLIGPFAGVLIDRWSRRQILVWSALLRASFVVATAALMAAGDRSGPLYIAVLLVLGVNRFFLSALSAALPHVVADDMLVMANSVSPTIGGLMATIGGVVALGLNVATGNTERGAAITVLAGGACYVAASMIAATMPRDLLGPARETGAAPPARLLSDLRSVAAGLADGARYIVGRRDPAAALGATGAFSLLFGPLFLMTILLYRNYFYTSSAGVAEGHLGAVVIASGIGYFCAALVTPPVTRRLSKQAWISVLLAASAVVTAVLGETFVQLAYLAIGFLLYLARQGVAISATTILQEDVDDAYRGRVFSFYDMMFNVMYVIGAALGAAFMPPDGRSPAIVAAVAAGYAVAAAAYWLSSSRGVAAPPGSGAPVSAPGSGAPASGPDIPTAAAQRNSSAVASSRPIWPRAIRISSRKS
jgi:MFS family permease